MGWCSGTELFDTVVEIIQEYRHCDLDCDSIMERLILAFQQQDWDCEMDSVYWKALVKPAMLRMGQLDDQD